MDLPGSNTLTGAVIGGLTVIIVEAIRAFRGRLLRKKGVNAEVEIASISDAAKLRREMVEQIERLWKRIDEQDNKIAILRDEVAQCESKHGRLVAAVRLRLPDFDPEAI